MDYTIDLQEEYLKKFLNEWETGDGISVKTSGSTGEPKEMVLPHSQVVRSARRSIRYFGIKRSSRLHCGMSFKFIGGKMMIARSLVSGCTLTYSEPALHLTPVNEDPKEITLMCVVPAQMPYILDHPEFFSNVKQYLIGGSAIDDRLWDRIVASGINAFESYAMTETATHVAMRRVKGPSGGRPRFVPLPGIVIRLKPDESIMIDDADVHVETNDLARMFPDGSFEILGRKDDVIVTGGLKVLPQELEKMLADVVKPFAGEFYVSSVPDEVWTSRLVLVVTPGSRADTPEELKRTLMEKIEGLPEEVLPKKLRPKEVILVDALPRTEMGKLNRTWKFYEVGSR